MSRIVTATAALAFFALTSLTAAVAPATAAAAPAPNALTGLSAVKHVWVVVLENENADNTFGDNSPAPYLSKTLPSMGAFIPQYFGVGHESLDNYIAMISGQAPNPSTQSDCQDYLDFAPSSPVIDGNDQAVGAGCVFPSSVGTLPGQLDAAGLTWRGYMEDMGTPCRHPALNTQDQTQKAKVGDQYAARHDPFMYFHSIIDDDPSCQAHVVDLGGLTADLGTVATTPNFSFITPNLCHDGHDSPCVDKQPGGLLSADEFLKQWVPAITDSPAFKHDGLLLVTFDEGETGGPSSATACCGEVAGPNSPLPGIDGAGGGRVGAVALSPFIAPGTTSGAAYNHYALLRSVEDIFGLDHLGMAGGASLQSFGFDVLTAAPGAPSSSGVEASGAIKPEAVSSPSARLATTGRSVPMSVWLAAVAVLAALVAFRIRRSTR
jgi:hypothetical protein